MMDWPSMYVCMYLCVYVYNVQAWCVAHVLRQANTLVVQTFISVTHSWFVYKHARPLPEEIVRFPPYPERDDPARGTTVLPYLEAFYNYDTGNAEEQQPPLQPQLTLATTWGADMGVPSEPPSSLTPLPPPRSLRQQGNWLSEDPCFLVEREDYSRASNNSSDKADNSTENITLKKSRVCSRENGENLCRRNCILCLRSMFVAGESL